MRFGADSGGTFTDIVGIDGSILKIPSTPADPGSAVREGIGRLAGGSGPQLLAHGTTVATNALLERRGARVALVTTGGFRDVIEVARQHRPSLYDPWADRPAPLVERADRVEVRERLDATGAVLEGYEPGSCPTLPDGIGAVAICLLHADLDPVHERVVAEELRARGLDVSASHEVAPEFREYERTVTTVVNASLRPVCRPYLLGLGDVAEQVEVMTSSGGLVDVERAAELPAALLLSGPAGGVRAAAEVAVACGHPDAVSFDMGGTSTDVCLILDGAPAPAAQRSVAGFPIRLPSLDVHTIGAGGGSIARIDEGGALVVGPESAGAVPGPACYGRGGTAPTVTDANLVAGRIPADSSFPELGRLDVDAARRALDDAGVTAEGVLRVADAEMERAIRAVSVERGIDPAGLALVAFGGAGPLHACALAEAVGMPTVIVPGAAGVLSAVGLLCAPRRREAVRSWPTPSDHTGLDEALAELADGVAAAMAAESPADSDAAAVEVSVGMDCRYAGQSHELTVASVADFHAEHLRRNGYERPHDPVEVVALRAVATLPAPADITDVLERWAEVDGAAGVGASTIVGPQVVVRPDCTTWVPDGWKGSIGPLGSLVLHRSEP